MLLLKSMYIYIIFVASLYYNFNGGIRCPNMNYKVMLGGTLFHGLVSYRAKGLLSIKVDIWSYDVTTTSEKMTAGH